MIPTLKYIKVYSSSHLTDFRHPHFAFCCRNTHKCFREYYFLKKSARESLFLVLFKSELQLSTEVLNAAMWNVFVATLLQRTRYCTPFTNVLPICQELWYPLLAQAFFIDSEDWQIARVQLVVLWRSIQKSPSKWWIFFKLFMQKIAIFRIWK